MSRVEKNRLEWIVFTISLVVVGGTLGFLIWDAAQWKDSPPDLVVELGAPEPKGQGWAVPVTVENRGGETAEGVNIEVILALPGGREEEAGFEAAFVPRGSQREGWVHFLNPPQAGRLRSRVTGYEQP